MLIGYAGDDTIGGFHKWLHGTPRRLVEGWLEPLIKLLIGGETNANNITTLGTLLSVASAVSFSLGHLSWGGFLLLLSGVFDILDGRVARGGTGPTKFGAFYDSTMDRIADAALFFGIAMYFVQGGLREDLVAAGVAISMMGMGFTLSISYARARAEGLGIDCKVGVAQRAERILGLGFPMMLFGAAGEGLLLLVILVILTLLAAITVVQRIWYVYKVTEGGQEKL
jgi:CDP-diacylglycerol--glycerol-3-phosphate 3-phosphatidyltransferase